MIKAHINNLLYTPHRNGFISKSKFVAVYSLELLKYLIQVHPIILLNYLFPMFTSNELIEIGFNVEIIKLKQKNRNKNIKFLWITSLNLLVKILSLHETLGYDSKKSHPRASGTLLCNICICHILKLILANSQSVEKGLQRLLLHHTMHWLNCCIVYSCAFS